MKELIFSLKTLKATSRLVVVFSAIVFQAMQRGDARAQEENAVAIGGETISHSREDQTDEVNRAMDDSGYAADGASKIQLQNGQVARCGPGGCTPSIGGGHGGQGLFGGGNGMGSGLARAGGLGQGGGH